MKNAVDARTEKGTCSEENAISVSTENGERGSGDQPPQKRKRLSNREYKKLMKGQNKVSDTLEKAHLYFCIAPFTYSNTSIHSRLVQFHSE